MVSTDVDALHQMFGDAEAMRYYPAAFTRDDVVAWIGWQLRNYDQIGIQPLDEGGQGETLPRAYICLRDRAQSTARAGRYPSGTSSMPGVSLPHDDSPRLRRDRRKGRLRKLRKAAPAAAGFGPGAASSQQYRPSICEHQKIVDPGPRRMRWFAWQKLHSHGTSHT
jgi:hypothetical protein